MAIFGFRLRSLNLYLGGFLVSGVVATSWCLPARAQPPAVERHFVTVPGSRGVTLAGAAIILPDALRGHPTVLVMGFSRSSGTAVAGWERRLDADLRESTTVAHYQIAMLGSVPRLLRGVVLSQIRSSVPEADRPHFISITENEAAWRKAAHFAQAEDAYVLVLDRTGAVRWQTAGSATDEAYRKMKDELAEAIK